MNEQYHVSTTYSPLTGQFVKGDHSDANFAKQDFEALASLTGVDRTPETTFAPLVGKLSSTDNKVALLAKAAGQGMHALKAAADPVNLSHLQQIQLIRTVIGTPSEYFALENFFTTLNVDMLQAREPIQSTETVGDYLHPLEETEANELKFDEISYNLLKLPAKIYTPIEDIMRTVINPQTLNIAGTNWALKKKRNEEARKVIIAGITDNTNVGVIDALAAGAFHSTNHTASNIAAVINTHLTANSSLLTHIAISNVDFAKYTENTWTSTGPTNMQFNRVIGAGVLPFPGVAGLTAVVDPSLATGTAYLVDKMNGSRLAEGPKTTRRWFDEERDAEVIKLLDFNEFKIVSPDQAKVARTFNKKITFA